MLDSDRFDWFASISLLFMPSWSVVWESLVYPLSYDTLWEIIEAITNLSDQRKFSGIYMLDY